MNLKEIRDTIDKMIESGIAESSEVVDYENTDFSVDDIYYDVEEDEIYIRFEERED